MSTSLNWCCSFLARCAEVLHEPSRQEAFSRIRPGTNCKKMCHMQYTEQQILPLFQVRYSALFKDIFNVF